MKWRSLDESDPTAESRSLREIYAERKELIAKYVPAATQAVHTDVIENLKRQGIAERALAKGAPAPPFELKDQNGKLVSSADLLSLGRVVICFIRGRWDPFCCGQMEAMDRVLAELQQAGAALMAISPQTVQQSFFMVDQHKLRFPLLSDPGNRVARQFGLVYRVPEKQEAIYRSVFVNLPFVNGEPSWELPIPATYILERDGTVLWASANADYMERPEPAEIVSRLQAVG
jgi:peroxiredoxin